MNRFLLCLSIVLSAAGARGQQKAPAEAMTGDGRVVILKPDGTWEYKKETPHPPPGRAAESAAPGAGADTLPAGFAGHDVETLFNQLGDLKKRLTKSEFETTAEYERRAAQERRKPLLGSLTVGDTFSLVVPAVEASYDADAQRMQFFLPVEKNRLAELLRRTQAGRDRRAAFDLEHANLYSIRWYDDRAGARQAVFFNELGDLTLTEKDYRQGFAAAVGIGVEEAKRLKGAARALLVARFEEPFVESSSVLSERQLQVRLLDVHFFDPQTGRVLAKVSQSRR